MARNALKDFPGRTDLLEWYSKNGSNTVHEVNGHFHTPYSFSAFRDLRQVFDMAKEEQVKVLGINDFYTMAGYEEFHDLAVDYKLFPLFNIEFMGLLKDEQKNGIRVNDPTNPGRTYFSGKGLDFPVSLEGSSLKKLENVRAESLNQTRKMVELASRHLQTVDPDLTLDYDDILDNYTKGMVRERHIARVIRIKLFASYTSDEERKKILKKLYGGKETAVNINNAAALEGEIRNNLLKVGRCGFCEGGPEGFPRNR